jgi:hypothetical protein
VRARLRAAVGAPTGSNDGVNVFRAPLLESLRWRIRLSVVRIKIRRVHTQKDRMLHCAYETERPGTTHPEIEAQNHKKMRTQSWTFRCKPLIFSDQILAQLEKFPGNILV